MGFFIFAAQAVTLPASVYGLGEVACGDAHAPRPCAQGAQTASGETFDPRRPTAAVFMPARYRVRPHWLFLRAGEGPCVAIWVNDKGNPRYHGKRGLDLTPGAFEALTGSKARPWSSLPKLERC
jgi:hypothetical protein